jgi:periplasmic protein TonB
MSSNRIPGLEELAFEGRNKAYGAYYLRKHYIHYLFIALISGMIITGATVFAVWFYYFFEPVEMVGGEVMYEIDYYAMSPPPDDESTQLAQSFSKPVQETLQAPVVADSLLQEEKNQEESAPADKPEEQKLNVDSAAKAGGSGLGTGVGDDVGIATNIDVYPRFPGGDEARLFYLRRQVRYPEAALKELVQGVVMVVFVVEIDGTVSNVNVPNRIGGGCDDEAIRVTKEMPRWEPGKRKGRAVRVMVRMPIVFKIPGKAAVKK